MRSIGGVEYDIPDSKPLIAYQSLDYLRAFYNNRIAWSRLELHALRCRARSRCGGGTSSTSFSGWSRDYTCEDIELTFRVHEVLRRAGASVSGGLPPRSGRGDGRARTTVRKLVAQRERWQRVILETWWAYRHMCFNRRYGAVGLLGMPFYLVSEIVAPVFELVAIDLARRRNCLGSRRMVAVRRRRPLRSPSSTASSTPARCSWSISRRVSTTSVGIARLFALMPLELVVYRPIMAWARLKGTWRFLRGDRAWHKFERNVRVEAT